MLETKATDTIEVIDTPVIDCNVSYIDYLCELMLKRNNEIEFTYDEYDPADFPFWYKEEGLIMSNVINNQYFPAPILTNDAFIDFVDMYYEYHLNMHDEQDCEHLNFDQFIAMTGIEI